MSTLVREARQPTQLNLLQKFEIRHADTNTPLTPALQRLVCFLAFQPSPARRTYVSGTLWADADDQHASASLRSALWRLHPLHVVCASSTHLWLDPGVEVDLHEVTGRAMAVLRSRLSDEELVETGRELVDAGHDILPGFDEDWVIAERESFRQIRLQALDRIGDLLIQRGRCCEALQVALAVTQAEPLRESAHRLLIRIHLIQGNVAEAIRQYHHYAQIVGAQLDCWPSPILQDLIAPYLPTAARTHSEQFPVSSAGRVRPARTRPLPAQL